MTSLFILGLMLLVIGINPKFWELIGWAPKDEESGESIGGRRFIRLILIAIGAIMVSFNFPGVPENLSYPGWFFFGVVAMYVWLGKRWTDVYPFSMEDFKDDDDVQVVLAWVRIIAMILAALGIGVGMQAPDEPCSTTTTTTTVTVEQDAPAAEPVPTEAISSDSSG